jgi:hypothetical protein
MVPANAGAGKRTQWVQAVTATVRLSILFFRVTKFFAKSVKSRLISSYAFPQT